MSVSHVWGDDDRGNPTWQQIICSAARPSPNGIGLVTLSQEADPTMNGDDLKAMQAPLKDRYKTEPASALITLRARGRATDGIACKVETGKALVQAGLHPATGGDGSFACS